MGRDWLESFLKNRRQRVRIGDEFSDYKLMDGGVPQGTTLAPLLFLIYINDIQNAAPELSRVLFADDTTVYLSGPNYSDLINSIN